MHFVLNCDCKCVSFVLHCDCNEFCFEELNVYICRCVSSYLNLYFVCLCRSGCMDICMWFGINDEIEILMCAFCIELWLQWILFCRIECVYRMCALAYLNLYIVCVWRSRCMDNCMWFGIKHLMKIVMCVFLYWVVIASVCFLYLIVSAMNFVL